MPHPQSIVQTVTAPAAVQGTSDTDPAFIAALFEKGPQTAQLITSIDQAQTVFGKDTAYTQAASYLEAYFRIGGNRAWVSRIVGPTVLAASITFNGTGAVASVKFTANDVGAYANSYRAAMIAPISAGIRFQLTDAAGNILVQSPDLADKAAVLAYTGAAKYGTFSSAGAGTIPVAVALANLTGGTDDNTNVTDTQRTAALARFTAAMGPGQVLLPGDVRQQAATLLGIHGAANNRWPLPDMPDSTTAATITSAATALVADANAQIMQPVAVWGQGPAIVSGGTLRDIPPSIMQAAIIARQDRLTGNPNQPTAADNGIVPWIVGLKSSFTDAELDAFTDAGVNYFVDLYGNGQYRQMGNRTLANPTTNRLYLQASNGRLDMLIRARGKLIADRYVHKQIDAYGHTASKYGGDLTIMLSRLRGMDALFPLVDGNGDEIDPGYVVDTSTGPENSSAVNKPSTTAAGQLIAVIGARRTPGADLVYLKIVNHIVGEAL
jgi:hypothetical protein